MLSTRLLTAIVGLLLIVCQVHAEDKVQKEKVDKAIERGLEWLRSKQFADGHWEAKGGMYPNTMTGMAGMTFLQQGSTLREGKYSEILVKATEFLMKSAQPSGLLGDISTPQGQNQYIYGHGFALLFLASVYGDELDKSQRKKLEAILKRAVKYCGDAQSSRGGWYYLSCKDGQDLDEGSTTVTQLQGLRAARNAGIPVPTEIIDKATKYLEKATTQQGGVRYSLTLGDLNSPRGRPAVTAAAVACAFAAGHYDNSYSKRWLTFCRENIPFKRGLGPDASGYCFEDYSHYYLAQAVYILGEDRYAQMFPNSPESERMTWSKYKAGTFSYILTKQNAEGSWNPDREFGGDKIYTTSVNLTIMQLDKATLPIYHR